MPTTSCLCWHAADLPAYHRRRPGNTSYAGFAHVNWEFGAGWSLAGRSALHARDRRTIPHHLDLLGDPLAALDRHLRLQRQHSWTALTPSLSLQKQFSAGHGLCLGQPRLQVRWFQWPGQRPAEVSTFDPEYVWTYEAGLKMRSADGRARANVAVFHSDYKDFQARVSEVTESQRSGAQLRFPGAQCRGS